MTGDADRLHPALAPVESAARDQSWDRDRPWRRRSHVWWEERVLVVDLHDLKARNAKAAVQAVLGAADELEAPAVEFVVGRGRHSHGGGVLPRIVSRELREACRARPGWIARRSGPGRVALVLDPARAPRRLAGGLGWWFWVGVLCFAAVAIWAIFFAP